MSKLKFMKIFRRTLTKHSLVSVFFLLLLLRKEKQKINLSFFVKFWRSVDENSSITCSATDDKFSILYYFNSKHLDLDYLLSLLNTFVREQQLDRLAWKLPFKMNVPSEELWVYNYFKRIELYVKKRFFVDFLYFRH